MDRKTIQEALEYGAANGQNSSTIFSEARDCRKWEALKKDGIRGEMFEEVKKAAERLLEEPMEALPLSVNLQFDPKVTEDRFRKLILEQEKGISAFCVMSLTDGSPKYIDALQDLLRAVCERDTWCSPSALESLRNSRKGEHKDSELLDEQVIDLLAAKMGFALVEICSLLEDTLSAEVVERVRREVRHRVIDSYMEPGWSFWWETSQFNWASVCAGSTGAAALYLVDDPEELSRILEKVLGSLNCYLSGFEEDGACKEGLLYWNFGFSFYVFFAELLNQRTAGKIDLMKGEKIRQISLFQQKWYLYGNKAICFSDSKVTVNYQIGLTHRLKSIFPDVEVPAGIEFRERFGDEQDMDFWGSRCLRNFIWSEGLNTEFRPLECTYYLEKSQYVVSKKQHNGKVISFAVKGGHNGNSHNHNDVGNFILDVSGETFIADIGRGMYTKDYFSGNRYAYFCTSSQGHSLPVINGRFQAAGREHEAVIKKVELGADRDTVAMEISKAYSEENLKSLVRELQFIKTDEMKVSLEDTFIFNHTPDSLVERFISFCPMQMRSEGLVRMQGAKFRVDVRYNPGQLDCEISKTQHLDYFKTEMDVYVLDLKVRTPTPEKTVRIEFLIA